MTARNCEFAFRIMTAWLATVVVVSADAKPISINAVSNLTFGSGVQGDPPVTIPPGTAENAQNASFVVSGDANRAYSISLPNSDNMTTGNGNGAKKKIIINNFQCYPLSGLLNSSGKQNIYVGATRASILSNQVAGSYSGSFRITVVY